MKGKLPILTLNGVLETTPRTRRCLALVGLVACLYLVSFWPALVAAQVLPIIVANTNDLGPGSLRAAIQVANATPGPHLIVFQIPTTDPGFNGQWFTIRPLSPLPVLTQSGTTIDGSTQTVFTGDTNASGPEIELDGTNAGAAHGLAIVAGNCSVKGLAINRFTFPNTGGVGLFGGGANVIAANFIGTDPTGSLDLGNRSGVLISGSSNNTIGGVTPQARNVISGNDSGIVIVNSAMGNLLRGNFIGTNAAGTAALGNSGFGIFINGSSNTIGGTDAGSGNIVSGNLTGIRLENTSANPAGNLVQGNFIGTDVSGNGNLGNSTHGVFINTSNNTIGGAAPAAGNVIAYNGGDGVCVHFGTGNAIRMNSISNNTDLGIDLGVGGLGCFDEGGVTPNDQGDADVGANDLQNFPNLFSASRDDGSITIRGMLRSTPDTTFTVEFFTNAACDPSGFGEGQEVLGSTVLMTNRGGVATFSVTFPTTVDEGQFITATATDPSDNSSEFSQCQIVH